MKLTSGEAPRKKTRMETERYLARRGNQRRMLSQRANTSRPIPPRDRNPSRHRFASPVRAGRQSIKLNILKRCLELPFVQAGYRVATAAASVKPVILDCLLRHVALIYGRHEAAITGLYKDRSRNYEVQIRFVARSIIDLSRISTVY